MRTTTTLAALGWAAWIALAVSALLSWIAAGPIGGSFHVLFLAMAWLYNVALSRTVWSWLPYAVAFGAMPAFLYVANGDPAAAPLVTRGNERVLDGRLVHGTRQ